MSEQEVKMSEQVNYRQQWAEGEIEAGTLLDAIDSLQYANIQLAQKFGVAHAEAEALENQRAEQWRLRREAEARCDTQSAVIAQIKAEAEALRVALLEIASANPAERGIEWAKSYASDGLKGAGSELYARWLDTFKEAEALRAENGRLREERDSFQRVGIRAMEALEAARGLLRHMRHATRIQPSCQAGIVSPCRCVACVDSRTVDFLTSATSPEVPDHIENVLTMVGQGERQEASQDVQALVSADDVRDACANAVSVFAEEANADQCREVAEYMREVLLVQIAHRQAQSQA